MIQVFNIPREPPDSHKIFGKNFLLIEFSFFFGQCTPFPAFDKIRELGKNIFSFSAIIYSCNFFPELWSCGHKSDVLDDFCHIGLQNVNERNHFIDLIFKCSSRHKQNSFCKHGEATYISGAGCIYIFNKVSLIHDQEVKPKCFIKLKYSRCFICSNGNASGS